MNSKVKGKQVMTNEDLQEYLDGDFKQAVLNWNNRVGNGVTEGYTCVQVLQKVINQNKRLIEEQIECLVAYQNNDNKERLDGLIDVYFVKVMVDAYYEALDKFSDEEVTEASLSFSEDDLLTLQVAPQLLSPAIIAASGVNIFNPKRFYVAAELIVENNMQKYTGDYEKMLTWKKNLKEGQEIKVTTVDGIDWYSITRLADGKVEKPFDFVPVKLNLH